MFDINEKQGIHLTIKEEGQPTEIIIVIPDFLVFTEQVNSINRAYDLISELTPEITKLSLDAFEHGNRKAWETIQFILYYWNYRDLTRKNRINDYHFLVEYALRKVIIDIQQKYTIKNSLVCVNNFTPKQAVQELADRVHAHRINTHPLLEEMAAAGLRPKALQVFLENYYVNNRLFHLFIAALSLSAPYERRTELAHNFYDEMGEGDLSMAHPTLFLKNFNSIGRPKNIYPLPEALYLTNTKTYAAFLTGDYHYGMGGFGYIELAMPDQMRKILKGLEKSGIPKPDLEFWDVHITLDLEHGKTWFAEMLDFIKTPEQAEKCLNGGVSLLDARATMFDGVLKCL